MKTEFLPEAEDEFVEAARHYEGLSPGVGFRFVAEVYRCLGFVSEHPLAAPEEKGVRKKLLNHFPYNLLYAIESNLIVVVAVAHQKRRPGYWRSRVKKIKAVAGRFISEKRQPYESSEGA
jgi:plasmid stabilization system protein ParE